MFSIAKLEAFGSERGRDHRGTGSPRLQNLDARSTSRKKGNDRYLRLRDDGNGILYKAGDLDVRIASDEFADGSGVFAQDFPLQFGPAGLQCGPDIAMKEAEGLDVWRIFEIAAE